jgi:aminomethyltransferase
MGVFAGFEMPLWYTGTNAEHEAVRTTAGVFDLSHMGEFFIEGREAFDLVQYLTCNDLRRIGDKQCQYTLLPTPEGGVIDDLIAYQYHPEKYLLVVNASRIQEDLEWITSHNRFDCNVTDRSDEYSLVAVQGPKMTEMLKDFGIKSIARVSPFTFKTLKVDGRSVIVAGTGYTGERGVELIVKNKDAQWLWDGVMASGEKYGAVPVGLGARDTLRLEMAYSLYGHELSETISVLEANLGWTVRFGTDFIGRDVLLRQQEAGVTRIVVGLHIDPRQGAARPGAKVYTAGGELIGEVTSGASTASIPGAIALALIKPEHSEPGTELQVDIRRKPQPCRVVEVPFYDPKRKCPSWE